VSVSRVCACESRCVCVSRDSFRVAPSLLILCMCMQTATHAYAHMGAHFDYIYISLCHTHAQALSPSLSLSHTHTTEHLSLPANERARLMEKGPGKTPKFLKL